MTPVDDLVSHRTVDVGDVTLHVVEAGEGPLVVLLHGFPDFWYSWRHQIPALVAGGFRVLAPDLRGYNLSGKPRGIGAYRVETIARDVERLVAWSGAERASVVGHDWGAAAAWQLAMQAPDIVQRLAILNVPHPLSMAREIRTIRQLRKSWYIGAFQVPWIPEAVLRARHFSILRRVLRTDPANPDAFTEEDIERYVEAWSRCGDFSGPVNYYRALRYLKLRGLKERLRPIDIPTLVIWGDQDRYLGRELAEPPRAYVPHVRVEHLPRASHWIHLDEPERVSALLLSFLHGE